MNKIAFVFQFLFVFSALNPITIKAQNNGSIGIGFSYNSNDLT